MSSPAKAHEPTMEEILASIRRIISDDDPAAGKAAAPRAAAAPRTDPMKPSAVEPEMGQADVDAMFAEMNAPAPKADRPLDPPPPTEFEDDLEVLELTEDMEEAPDPSPARPASAMAPPPRQAQARALAPSDGLLSAKVDEQVSSAFGSLAHTVLAGNARTLDDIVREMLRPMLRAWLDDNLPPLVERLVRQEIERVARGGR